MSEAGSAPLPFRLRRRHDGRYDVDLTHSGAHGVALLSRPPDLEPRLHKGSWLVLAFAAWSGPDRLAVPIALAVAAGHPGFDVAIRPYDRAAEFATWPKASARPSVQSGAGSSTASSPACASDQRLRHSSSTSWQPFWTNARVPAASPKSGDIAKRGLVRAPVGWRPRLAECGCRTRRGSGNS